MTVGMSTTTEVCQIIEQRIHKNYFFERGTSERIFVVTTRPDHVWPEVWNSTNPLKKEIDNTWTNEKPKLENARRMRGISFIDLEDEEYKETIKNARKKLEVQMKAAMPCKKKNTSYSPCRKLQQGLVGAPDKVPKTKYACIVESHESNERNQLCKKEMKITSLERDIIL